MSNVNKLIEVLDQQSKVYNDLLDISKNKKEIIVEGKVQELENITKVEQTIVLKMGPLEDQLESAIDGVVKELGITEKDVTMSVVLDYLQGDEKSKLEEQKEKIYTVIEELSQLNKLNSQLIKNSLDYINFSVNLYSNMNSNSTGGYEQSGEIKTTKSSFFDKKL